MIIKIEKLNITLHPGGPEFKGKGIATKASDLLIKESYYNYHLNKIYLYTEVDNLFAQKLFERIGFIKEGVAQTRFDSERKKSRQVYIRFTG